ncbi:L10-interacting MYB domain-containing protein [Arachis hypogaea]|nr:L10-interacting MYB domain-containing protein [Arachis hypogaea]
MLNEKLHMPIHRELLEGVEIDDLSPFQYVIFIYFRKKIFLVSVGNTGPPPPFPRKVPSSRSTGFPSSSSRNVPSTGSVGPLPPGNDSSNIDLSPPSSVPSEPAYIPFRPGTHFNKVDWANLKTKFLKETGLNYESKQFKNKWEAMKREWGLWAKLKGKETGLGWDPIKKTIQTSDDWWDAKIQENPDVAKFREEGPKHLDEMEFLFEDVVATDVGAWAPSEDINDSYNDRYNDEDNGNEEEGLEDELNDESTPPNAMRQKRRKVEKGSGASQLSTQLERIINVFEGEKANEIAHKNNVPSISICLAVLKQLPGLEVGSDIFFIATRLMAKRSNREIFMGLEDSALQLGWLKTHSLADVSGS